MAQHDTVQRLKGSSDPSGNDATFTPIASAPIDTRDRQLIDLGRDLQTAWQAESLALQNEKPNSQEDDGSIAVARSSAIVDRILRLRATTVAGLNVKLSAYHWCLSGAVPENLWRVADTTEDKLIASVVADASAMMTGLDHLPHSNLDAPLEAAWAEFTRLLPHLDKAQEAEEEIFERYKLECPKRPDALRPLDGDFPEDSIRFGQKIESETFYGDLTIDILRSKPRTRVGLEGARIPSPEDQQRADEIVAAWDEWQRHLEAFAVKSGLTSAEDRTRSLFFQCNDLCKILCNTPALSLRGIGLKASWALSSFAGECDDKDSVLKQVKAFADRHAYAGTKQNIPFLESMMDLPAADWGLYRTFNHWLQSSFALDALYEEPVMAAPVLEADQLSQLDLISAKTADLEEGRNRVLRQALIDTPATSLEGVRLKGHVYAWLCRHDNAAEANLEESRKTGATTDHTMAFSIARDLARLAPAKSISSPADYPNPRSSKPDARALEAYRTWLSNEFRALTAEMYPDNREMTGVIAVNNAGDRFHFRGEPPASTRAEAMLRIIGLDWTNDTPSAFAKHERAA